MKPGIHPECYDVEASCACGNSFATRSTNKEIKVEICSACHPFFTGKQKLIDSEGRVERFNRKYANLSQLSSKKKNAEVKVEAEVEV